MGIQCLEIFFKIFYCTILFQQLLLLTSAAERWLTRTRVIWILFWLIHCASKNISINVIVNCNKNYDSTKEITKN